jgi:Fe-S oxidoreductase
VGCCQRPKISHGFLRDAKKEGTQTVERLREYMNEGLTIVVCEPGCASALNDDLADLIEDNALAAQLQKYVKMIDVFLAEEIESGNLNKTFEATAEHILIHGHCHQKALYSTKGLKTIFAKTGGTVKEIPSGCCGMAGSFGYEREHYDISQKIGEEILFPAVRSIKDGTVVVANGFSCRHQVEHFTGVKPKHWVEIITVR